MLSRSFKINRSSLRNDATCAFISISNDETYENISKN